MDIMELGAIGEFVSGIVVVGSLIFVGLQVRQNTAATRAANHHAITDSFNQGNRLVASDPTLAAVFRRGNESRADLTDDERVQYDFLWLSVLRILETLYYQSEVGAAERQLLEAEQRSLKAIFASPGTQEWWHANPYSFSAEFRTYAESFFPGAQRGEA